ncbi:MAG: surface lipoprotein assembly modifier [Antarcticimicrobium sp.]|uniref:surface lipoprotein assembly modifier n=1 Tax=Antarcticimicrobium sp. TaxID=2824147 RepID=UPI002609CC97|nr:surface lipoprotein assembly modifier [Antarcticimicrobium sp.]MDF1715781.1 surface lipoprotein assembly modifier [Antarcticimicrobium sp.]
MPTLRTGAIRALACLSMLAALALPLRAAPVELAPDQLRLAALMALRTGDAPRALRFSEALLGRNPADRTALMLRSRAARDLGQFALAKTSARAAWRLSADDAQKYASSLLMAQALSSDGHRTRAQWWLRRAVQHAPTEAAERKAIGDFRYVRARNPWSTQLSFSVTPESNINNGSSARSSILNYKLSELLFGQPVEYALGGTARALSGVEYALGVTTRYRFAETEARAHDLILTADLRSYTLSGEAKSIAPTAKGSDFAFATYTLGYGHRGLNLKGRGEYRVVLDGGQSWYGGAEYARFARVSAGQSYRLASGDRINLRLAGERQFGIATSDSDTLRADLSYTTRIRNGATLWTGATLAASQSPTAADEYREIALRTQLTLAKPVVGATLQMGLWARNRSYDVSPHSPDGRQEDRVQADLTLIFDKIDYYGFNPTMQLSASRTDSNIALYDANRMGVNFGIQSAF